MSYVFDRQLRLLMIDAIERFEIAFRSQLAYHHTRRDGNPFAYADDVSAALPALRDDKRQYFFEGLKYEMNNSKEEFVRHFCQKYGDRHRYPPIWIALEIMTFGQMCTLYRGSNSSIQQAVAKLFGVHDRVVTSWLPILNIIRNICAHHGRLWNRSFKIKPMIPKNDSQWHHPVVITNDRIFGVLTILKYTLDHIAPQSHWPDRVVDLLSQYPDIPIASMGFPENWKMCPIWNKPSHGK